MMEFWELYVSSFWAWLGITIGVSMIIDMMLKVYGRTIRHLNIRKHGYPTTPNLDADGDIVHPKTDGDNQ